MQCKAMPIQTQATINKTQATGGPIQGNKAGPSIKKNAEAYVTSSRAIEIKAEVYITSSRAIEIKRRGLYAHADHGVPFQCNNTVLESIA